MTIKATVAFTYCWFVNPKKAQAMLYTIALILIVLWALGLITAAPIGGFIHVLLVIAIVVVLVRIIQGRRPL